MRSRRRATAQTSRSTLGLPVRLTGYWSSLRLVPGALRFRLLRQRSGVWSGLTLRPAMLALARLRAAEQEVELRPARRRHTTARTRATRGDDLLPRPVSAASAHLGRSSPLLGAPVAALLPTNGRFAWNAFAFDHHIASAIDGQHANAQTPEYRCRTRTTTASAITGWTSPWTTVEPVRSGRQPRTNGWGPDVTGLRLEALYGGFAGEPLHDDSPEYVFMAVAKSLSLAFPTAPRVIPAHWRMPGAWPFWWPVSLV